ncbi:MAG: hypothetical protein JWN03_6505 [Nocardia sp.]|nr:hypothetical protein [Nocardia sp.]
MVVHSPRDMRAISVFLGLTGVSGHTRYLMVVALSWSDSPTCGVSDVGAAHMLRTPVVHRPQHMRG